MQQEETKNGNSPAFSVRIDMTDTGKKLMFRGKGNKKTSELFLLVLERMKKRLENAEDSTDIEYTLDEVEEKQVNLVLSKEQIEDILLAILAL